MKARMMERKAVIYQNWCQSQVAGKMLPIVPKPPNCLAPSFEKMGRGFDRSHHKVLLVGGGIGLAPLRFLAEDYPQADVDVLIGARTAEEQMCIRDSL